MQVSRSPRVSLLKRAAHSHGNLLSARMYCERSRSPSPNMIEDEVGYDSAEEDGAVYSERESGSESDSDDSITLPIRMDEKTRNKLFRAEVRRSNSPTPCNSDSDESVNLPARLNTCVQPSPKQFTGSVLVAILEQVAVEQLKLIPPRPSSHPPPTTKRSSSLPSQTLSTAKEEEEEEKKLKRVSVSAPTSPLPILPTSFFIDKKQLAFKRRGRLNSVSCRRTDLQQSDKRWMDEIAWADEVKRGHIPARVFNLDIKSAIEERCVFYIVDLESFSKCCTEEQFNELLNGLCRVRTRMLVYLKQLKRIERKTPATRCYSERCSVTFFLSCSKDMKDDLLLREKVPADFHWLVYPALELTRSNQNTALKYEKLIQFTKTMSNFNRVCKKHTKPTDSPELCRAFIFTCDRDLCESMRMSFQRNFQSNVTYVLDKYIFVERHLNDFLETIQLCIDALPSCI